MIKQLFITKHLSSYLLMAKSMTVQNMQTVCTEQNSTTFHNCGTQERNASYDFKSQERPWLQDLALHSPYLPGIDSTKLNT